LILSLHDQPGRPLRFETFINVGDPQQRADLAALGDQQDLYLLFYDEQLSHRLSKRLPNTGGESVTLVLERAQRISAAIPSQRYDFDRAKADVMRKTRL
jgi:hypothetical protein